MSSKLSQLLDKPEALVAAAVRKLEDMSGFPSADIKLLSDINLKVRHKTSSLGLDPNDTTGKELYHALAARYKRDEVRVSNTIGLSGEVSKDDFALKVAEFVSNADAIKDILAIKRSVAKSVLRAQPPRQLMKKLNYRSIESLLKREDINEVYAVLPFTESDRWLKNFWKAMAKVQASDFENRSLTVKTISPKYQTLFNDNELPIVSSNPYIGAVVVYPSSRAQNLGVIGLSLSIIDAINNLKIYNAFAKLHQVEAKFGAYLVQVFHEGLKAPAELVKLPISWGTILHHFGRKAEDEFSEIFGPHLGHEDIQLTNSLNSLAKLHPSVVWWTNLEYVAAHSGQNIVSFNLRDVITNTKNESPHSKSSRGHLEHSVWHELIDRYLVFPGFQSFIMEKVNAGDWRPPEPANLTSFHYDHLEDYDRNQTFAEMARA